MSRSVGGRPSRSVGAFALVAVLAASCQTSALTPSPATSGATASAATTSGPAASTAGPIAVPTVPPDSTSTPAAPIASASAVASPSSPLASTGSWVVAGPLPPDWYGGPLVALPDGGALAIAGDGSAVARWDPTASTWTKGPGLNAPRWNFAAVALRDGRVLVVGGANDRQQAYSSAYAYDPGSTGGSWTKVGAMGTARSAPAAALLQDGRVLVAGGAYFDRPTGTVTRPRAPTLAVPRPPDLRRSDQRRLGDVAPSHTVPALATAEIFDPATGTFSPTGSMRYARAGATAATLSDGRVLVVAPGGEVWVGSDVGVRMDARAATTTETFDPTTGRFALAGDLPEIDRAAIAAQRVDLPTTDPWMTSTGTLVALPDGGALLVGHAISWKHEADVVRTFRFGGGATGWRQIGRAWAEASDWQANTWHSTPGVDLAGAFVAGLPSGRVLAAGGRVDDGKGGLTQTDVARAFDPAADAWLDLPSMPGGRDGGGTVALSDGSVLLVGGDYSDSGGETAIRFEPGR